MSAALASAQRWMQDALAFPRRTVPARVARMLAGSPRISGAEGLAVYQRGYLLRIASCMREQFPALCHALGDVLFDDFVGDYVRDRPPESHTLYDLGRRFPAWLDEGRPDRERPPAERESWADFMVDLARFERQVFVMFDAPGHEGKKFADEATPDEQLRLQPCFALGAYRFPVAAYYHAVRRGKAPSLPPAVSSFAALVRSDYATRTVPLGEGQFVFLKGMQEGASVEDGIGAVVRHLALRPDEVRRSWEAEHRARWIAWCFFVGATEY